MVEEEERRVRDEHLAAAEGEAEAGPKKTLHEKKKKGEEERVNLWVVEAVVNPSFHFPTHLAREAEAVTPSFSPEAGEALLLLLLLQKSRGCLQKAAEPRSAKPAAAAAVAVGKKTHSRLPPTAS